MTETEFGVQLFLILLALICSINLVFSNNVGIWLYLMMKDLNKLTKKELIKRVQKLEKDKPKDNYEWIKIPEIGKEVTKPIVWTKPYNEIIVPEGCELLDVRDGFTIFDNQKYVDLLLTKEEQKDYLIFACKQLNIDKKNNDSRWLYRSRSGGLDAWFGGLLYSDVSGRVIFTRPLKNPLEKRSRKTKKPSGERK